MADTVRVSITLTSEDHREVVRLARLRRTSMSSLGQLAIRHLLLRANGGIVAVPPNFSPTQEIEPEGNKQVRPNPRVSVGLPASIAAELSILANRCCTSVSTLGELAFCELLHQASTGAIPLLPVPAADIEPENNLERSRMGRMVSHTAWSEDAVAEIQYCDARIEELGRKEKRLRLVVINDLDLTISPEAG